MKLFDFICNGMTSLFIIESDMKRVIKEMNVTQRENAAKLGASDYVGCLLWADRPSGDLWSYFPLWGVPGCNTFP